MERRFTMAAAPRDQRQRRPGGLPCGQHLPGPITADPVLGALGDNGGATLTIPILPGSSAIDTANHRRCPPSTSAAWLARRAHSAILARIS